MLQTRRTPWSNPNELESDMRTKSTPARRRHAPAADQPIPLRPVPPPQFDDIKMSVRADLVRKLDSNIDESLHYARHYARHAIVELALAENSTEDNLGADLLPEKLRECRANLAAAVETLDGARKRVQPAAEEARDIWEKWLAARRAVAS